MQVHRGYWAVPRPARGAVVAIGNFDGVHRGHRVLIETAKRRARLMGAPLGVVTFEPHPREVLQPAEAPPRLTPFRVKARLLAELGVEHMFVLAFNDELRIKTPYGFAHDVLSGGLDIRHAVVGYDFRFGHRAAGDVDQLIEFGFDHEFEVSKIEPVTWADELCSSSRIRAAVASGDVKLARDLLGHPFAVEGRVVSGDRRGRELGYPTANLRPPVRPALWPPAGIYAARVRLPDRNPDGEDAWLDAVVSLGVRPTFDGGHLLLEVHVFDHDADLYHQHLCCGFVARLRDEEKFDSVEALKAQMARDCDDARKVLATTRG
ncbi:MAG: bifunctional riboflavin kinase/FAD synthetase [Pseudomonadota bacterium]